METWEVQVETKRRYDIMTGEPRDDRSVYILGENERFLAVVSSYREDCEQIAQKMAAAPELLAACDEALAYLGTLTLYSDGTDGDRMSDVSMQLERAIGKALGQKEKVEV